jgi:RNA polymerase sigma-70 factor (ECF subfamily)
MPHATHAPGPGAEAISDEDLFRRFRGEGDASAFEVIVHRYEGELFHYLRRSLGSAEMAEDVFQATFLQVHLKRDLFEEGRRFRPWLYAIATNQAIDAQRRDRRHRMASLDRRIGGGADDGDAAFVDTLSGDDPVCDARLEEQEAQAWTRLAVAGLPEPMQSVLELVYQRGLKYREVADALGIPLGTVKSRLHAAIHRLNVGWRDECKSHGGRAVAVVTA